MFKFMVKAWMALALFALVSLSVGGFALAGNKSWPKKIPCRVNDSNSPEVLITTLGDVKTPLSQGVFDPKKDEVILEDGTVIENYYRDSLGIKFYRPIDKRYFPHPPAGWCSWYYYYWEISADEVKKNAEWMARNLKEYGAEYVQIDDGWQGRGRGYGDNRDWTTVDKRFPDGMDGLARYIKSFGLKPGLWLAPHGQSNKEVVRKWRTFLVDDSGRSIVKTWEGDYLLDPSKEKSLEYLKDLFTTLCDWGYEYFKIDGQPIVIREYKRHKNVMSNSDEDPIKLYRRTLRVIKETIGPRRYLLGCWGIPLEGIGIMDGCRTGGDVYLGWDGFFVALNATMKYYFLHNIVWYNDPDVIYFRSPLTLDMVRAWATLIGLTGQAVLTSDRLMDLSEDRVEVMRKIFPAADIRPLDLFPIDGSKRIIDLKVNHLGRSYDVVGCFNFDGDKKDIMYLDFSDLGLSDEEKYHVFDFWNKEYLGMWDKGYFVHLAPSSATVLTLMKAENFPQLISTSRHITQGWVDLVDLKFDPEELQYDGKSRVIADDPYELYFAYPSDKNFVVADVKLRGVDVEVENHQGWSVVRIKSNKTKVVKWSVKFEESDIYSYPVKAPADVEVIEPVGFDAVRIVWEPTYHPNSGYCIYYKGEKLGVTPLNEVILKGLDLNKRVVEVSCVWYDGKESVDRLRVELPYERFFPDEVFLSDIEPAKITSGWGVPKMDKSLNGGVLRIGEKEYEKGIGTHAISDIVYYLKGKYSKLIGEVGLDYYSYSSKQGSVTFEVYGDGKLLWSSGVMKYDALPKKLDVDIRGVDELRIHVGDAGDGINYDHANLCNLKVVK